MAFTVTPRKALSQAQAAHAIQEDVEAFVFAEAG